MENNSCIRQQADIEQLNRCKDTVSELSESFDYLANGLSLVGNSVRLKILYLLFEEKRLCVCDLSDILGMNISSIIYILSLVDNIGILNLIFSKDKGSMGSNSKKSSS